MRRPAKLVACAICFVGGLNYALPDYSWATPPQVLHGVFLSDFLVLLYLLALPVTMRVPAFTVTPPALVFAVLTACLGLLGVLSAVVNTPSLFDVGEGLKLGVLAASFLMAVYWGQALGATFPLRVYLAGVAVGGLLNLYFTFADPYLMLFGFPILRARNGAGGTLGIAVGLGAWLMLSRRCRSDTVVAVTASIVGLLAAAVSYSKTATSIAACGLVAWAFVLAGALGRRRLRRIGTRVLVALVAAGVFATQSTTAREALDSIEELVLFKFKNLDTDDRSAVSNRYMYFWGVAEVVGQHPLFGVGYSGFYDAITQTTTYRAGLMEDEAFDPDNPGSVNPHNSFLYYASANGLPGLVVVISLFALFLGALRRCQAVFGVAGRGVWLGLSLAYFVYAMTLPNMYLTPVLYLPAAAAASQAVEYGATRRARRRRVSVHLDAQAGMA